MSQAVLMNLIRDMYSKITLVKLLRHLPGANELTVSDLDNARPNIVWNSISTTPADLIQT